VAGGALFVFAGRSATRVKVLWFEAHGRHSARPPSCTFGRRVG
jgi:hypothetical protein